MTTPPTPPGWYPDPAGGGGRRYWDGNNWGPTEPLPSATPPGWYPDPAGGGGRRYWDGGTWGPTDPAESADNEASGYSDKSGASPDGSADGAFVPTPPSAGVLPPAATWWANSSRKTKVAAGGAAAATAVGLIVAAGMYNRHQNACSPAAPNPTRYDFVEGNELKDSLSDSWNESGGIGEEVRDGKLAFEVSSIEVCNDGYAKVAMIVTNTDDRPQTFNPEYQRLMRNIPPQTGPIPKGGFECQLCEGIGDRVRINPGDSIATVVPFAIQGDPAIMAVELHDSSLSFGVKVYP